MEKIINIDYMRCLKTMLRRLPLALIIGIAVAIVASVIAYFVMDHDNAYTARASAYTGNTSGYGNAAEGVQYAEIAKSLTVAERALNALGNTSLTKYDIYDMIEVEFDNENSYVNSSSVINIYATSSEPQLTIDVANEVTNAFVAEVSEIMNEDHVISVLDLSSGVTLTYNAQSQFFIIVGIAAGASILLVCFISVLLEILSLRLVTVQDATLYGKLNIIGVIPDSSEV